MSWISLNGLEKMRCHWDETFYGSEVNYLVNSKNDAYQKMNREQRQQ